MRWPTFSEWGLIALTFLIFFLVLYVGISEVLARRDVRKIRRENADRSR